MTPPTSLDTRPAQTEETAEYYRCHRAFVPLFGAGYLSDLVGGVMTPPYRVSKNFWACRLLLRITTFFPLASFSSA